MSTAEAARGAVEALIGENADLALLADTRTRERDEARRELSDHMRLPAPAGHLVIPEPDPHTVLLGGSYSGPVDADNQSTGGADERLYRRRAQVARLFCTGNLPADVRQVGGWQQAYADGVRVFIISWKGSQTGAQVAASLRTIPADCTVYGSYFHEPEDNIKAGSLTRAGWTSRHVEHANAMRGEGVTPVGIFMQYTLVSGSGRNIMDYACGDDGVLFDFYMNPAEGKDDPEAAIGRMAAACGRMGAKFTGTAETGVNRSTTGEAQAVELTKRCRAALMAEPLAALGTWWSTNEFAFTEGTATAWFEGR